MAQTDWKPYDKVAAGGVAGAATIVLVWLLGLAGVDMPPEVASAATALLGWLAAYWLPERRRFRDRPLRAS